MVEGGEAAADPRRRRLTALLLTLGVIFCVGALPVALDLARPHGLYGLTEYDDGVYLAASLRLIAGVFPYKDFVFVQPPGITVVLAPIAALSHLIGGRNALGAARVLTAGTAGINAVLVGYLLRRRGLFAVAVGGLAMAVFPTGYTAVHTFLLEPYCVLFCLLGACFVFAGDEIATGRRCAIGGAFFGFAGSIKVFAVVPILVIVVILLASERRKALRFAEGIGASIALFLLPFFIVAPSGFVHDVIASQLGRSTQTPTPLLNRVFALTGLAYASPGLEAVSAGGPVPAVPAGAVPTSIAGGGVAGVIAILLVRFGKRSERSPLAWFIVASAILGASICLIPAAYYDHYAYFSAPFLALALGAGACLFVRTVRSATEGLERAQRTAVRRSVAAIAVVLICGGAVSVLLASTASQRAIVDRFGDPGPQIATMVPPGRCTLSDSASLLASAGRADIGPPGCPAIVDATGMALSIDPRHPVSVRTGIAYPNEPTFKSPALVEIWRAGFGSADYVVLSGVCAARIPWTPSLARYFDTHFSQISGPYSFVFRRGAPATLAARPTLEFSCADSKAAAAAKAAALEKASR